MEPLKAENIYSTYIFTDKVSSQLMCKLTMRNDFRREDIISKKIEELSEKYSLPPDDILVE